MKLSTKIITVVLIVAGSSGAVYAFGKHNHWGMTPAEKIEFVGDRVSSHLEFNDQQRENFDSLAETVARLISNAKAGHDDQVAEIEAMLGDPSFNQARALELVQQKTQMVNENAPLVISQLAIFLDSLSIEQKQKMQGFLRDRHEHHRHGDGH